MRRIESLASVNTWTCVFYDYFAGKKYIWVEIILQTGKSYGAYPCVINEHLKVSRLPSYTKRMNIECLNLSFY